MNNLKFIILDYMAAKKSGIVVWRRYFWNQWRRQPGKMFDFRWI